MAPSSRHRRRPSRARQRPWIRSTSGTQAGRLEAAFDVHGSRRRFLYDAAGRLSGVLSGDGNVVQIRYDRDGHVREIAGPGIQRWRFQQESAGLRATDTLGHAWIVTTTGRRTVVTDPLARAARTAFDSRGRIVGATDPVGGEVVLRWWDDQTVELRTHAGRSFKVVLGPDRRPRSLELPSGARWRWTYDDSGRLLSITDPSGRRATWKRDETGNLVAYELGRLALRFDRDAAGRLVSITDALGSSIRIVRDPEGIVLAIEDAVGGKLTVTGGDRVVPVEIATRRKGVVTFGFDVLGRLADALDPVGGRLAFGRDSAGQLTRIVDSIFGETRIHRALDGAITNVVGPDRRTLGFVRDATGALDTLLRPDGTGLAIERGPLGEVIAIREGDEVFRIARDGDLRPVDVGPLSFAWSADDLAERVDTGAVSLRIGRDDSGRIRELAARGFSVAVERDESGQPVRWIGTDGVLDVVRDATGREIGETLRGADALSITRDPRGWIDRVDLGKRSWRIDREPGGSVIRVQGPEDLRLGHDVDALGRLTLVRYPSGALGRYRYDGPAVLEDIDSADGKEIQARRYELDPRGLRLSALDTAGLETLWRYDPLGEVVAIEGPDGAWAWTPDGYRGPEGEVLVSDRDGRAAEARPPSWPHAWSVAEEMLTVRRDPWGRMLELQGDLGSVDLVFDPIGRARRRARAGRSGVAPRLRSARPVGTRAHARGERRGVPLGHRRRAVGVGRPRVGGRRSRARRDGGGRCLRGDRARPVGRSHRAHDAGTARGAASREPDRLSVVGSVGARGAGRAPPALPGWAATRRLGRDRSRVRTAGRWVDGLAVVCAKRARADHERASRSLAVDRDCCWPGACGRGRRSRCERRATRAAESRDAVRA